jgi:hypothetical protein
MVIKADQEAVVVLAAVLDTALKHPTAGGMKMLPYVNKILSSTKPLEPPAPAPDIIPAESV